MLVKKVVQEKGRIDVRVVVDEEVRERRRLL